MRHSYLSTCLIATLIASLSFGQAKAQDNEEEVLHKKVDKLFQEWDNPNTPGAAVAIVRDGQIIYRKGYGMANLEYAIPITPSTIFHIASVSKQFTAFAILLLERDGKVSLEDDIRKYIPEVPDFGKKITLRHLATHTSGLRDQWNLLALAGWRLDDVITQEHILKLVKKQKELNFDPGKEYLYCNTGFTLLAEVVERASGNSFAEYTKDNIFEPLGMTRTLFYDDHEKVVKNRAYSYRKSGGSYKKSVLSYATVGATSLFTTVEDLSIWARNFENPVVGSPKLMSRMSEQGVLNSGDTIKYALGQSVSSRNGLKMVAHGGSDAGFRSYLARFPDQHFSVMTFSNDASFKASGMAKDIADIYLKDTYTSKNDGNSTKRSSKKSKSPSGKRPVVLEDYEGEYYSEELSTSYTFIVKKDRLVAEHPKHSDILLKHKNKDIFEGNQWFFGTTDFERNTDGQITGCRISSGRVRNLKFRKISD